MEYTQRIKKHNVLVGNLQC